VFVSLKFRGLYRQNKGKSLRGKYVKKIQILKNRLQHLAAEKLEMASKSGCTTANNYPTEPPGECFYEHPDSRKTELIRVA
jgi:hypothetical protein